jgi:hypothetical protein
LRTYDVDVDVNIKAPNAQIYFSVYYPLLNNNNNQQPTTTNNQQQQQHHHFHNSTKPLSETLA